MELYKHKITIYPPTKMRVSARKINEYLEDFDWSRLGEGDKGFNGSNRKSLVFQLSHHDYAAFRDHCEYYEKSYTQAVVQALIELGFCS